LTFVRAVEERSVTAAVRALRLPEHAGISLLSLLPDVLHIQGRGGKPPEWLAGISALLGSEAQERRLGRSAVMTRLTDVLLVQVLRHWIHRSTDRRRSLLALRDARIGSVLTLIHANLEAA
jgi:AraC family transcriptional regulator, alkane utilization regulator